MISTRQFTYRSYDLLKMDKKAIVALRDLMWPVHSACFRRIEDQHLLDFLTMQGTSLSMVKLALSEQGDPVGYAIIHYLLKDYRGRSIGVWRGASGFLPGYRGRGNLDTLLFRWGVLYRLKHPIRPMYVFGASVHPSSYVSMMRGLPKSCPHYERPTPPRMLELLLFLADDFGMRRVEGAGPTIRDVGWSTRQSEQERDYWATCDRPAARAYISMNPSYEQGHGVLVLAPLQPGNMLVGAAGSIVRNLSRRMRSGSGVLDTGGR